MGRDVFRAIDAPLTEAKGGPIWGRIPSDAPVVGLDLAGVAAVYPLLVLDRVQVVNDLIAGRPILVTYNPYAPPDSCVKVYEALLDGQRVTMGTSGYYLDGNPPALRPGIGKPLEGQGERAAGDRRPSQGPVAPPACPPRSRRLGRLALAQSQEPAAGRRRPFPARWRRVAAESGGTVTAAPRTLLLTNDDGIDAPGLEALRVAAARFGRLAGGRAGSDRIRAAATA